MKRLALVFVALLTAIALKAQVKDRENGFIFNVFEIENVEERIQLASALAISDVWICNPTDNPGELYIRPNSYNQDIPIYAEFDYLRMTLHEEYEEASQLTKEEFKAVLNSWAHNISSDYYNFLISDHLDRANHCMDAEPFCTTDTYNFPALNSGFSWSGPDYGCLGTSPTNKHSFWYYMRIGVAGNITIKLEADFDVDFAMWGPFENQIDPCPVSEGEAGMLTSNCSSCPNNTSQPNFYPSGNLHDCSFDPADYEYAHVVNGEVGQFFILLITNYAGSSGNITFRKYAGDGETDCGILPPLVENDGPYCTGETIQLHANGQSGSSYNWTGPNGFTSTDQNPTLGNATVAMSGDYTCTITLGTATNYATTEVIVNAMPEPTATAQSTYVNYGSTTQLNVNPGVQGNFSYHWEPENMVTNPDIQNPTTVVLTSTQQFTVTVTNTDGDGHCTASDDITIEVGSGLTATASADEYVLCQGNSTTLHAYPTNGTGNYTFSWEPAELLNNANAQNPVATPNVGTNTFTCQVSDGMATRNVQVIILVNPNAEPTHIYEAICPDETYTFYGETFNTETYKEHLDHTQFGCDSLVCLHLSLNQAYDKDFTIDTCNEFSWPSMGKPFTGDANETIYEDGVYQRTYESIHRCDSVVTINAKFEYSPHPSDSIMSPEASIGVAPHAIITASEFQINTYDFTVTEQGLATHWNPVEWTLKDQYGHEVDWPMETEDNGRILHLTVFEYIEGRLYLTATISNRCATITRTHWLECTFYGIEEEAENRVNVDIVPNPNNGQMTLNFEYLTGKVNIKVYDMKGNLIDNFDTYSQLGPNSLNYDMKVHTDGMYFFVFSAKEGTITKKVMVTQ